MNAATTPTPAQTSDTLKSLIWFAALFAAGGGGTAFGQEHVANPEVDSPWYMGIRTMVGASHEETDFRTLPAGASDGDEDSYNPQESIGADFMLGYHFSACGIPLRAELSASCMFRHDADMMAVGLANPYYENNLRIWDARLSLMADIADFGWGRFYVGGGLGAALLESEVSIVGLSESANNFDWRFSPSLQAGIIIDDVLGNLDLELAYRFRWFGDTASGTFPDGAKIDYEDTHVHEIILGLVVPLGG